MLDQRAVDEFLDTQLSDAGIEIPLDIKKSDLVSAFCEYVEKDYYEWLKDNYRSFFNHYHPDWEWIRKRIRHHK